MQPTETDPAPSPEEHSKPCDIRALVPLMEMRNRIGYVYGSEDAAMLLYSLVRREQPKNVVELGAGLGVSAAWMGQAMKELGAGQLWTIDDGSHWEEQGKLKLFLGQLLQVPPFNQMAGETLDYAGYMRRMIEVTGLSGHVNFIHDRLELSSEEAFYAKKYGFLARPIDALFIDINRTPDVIIDTLFMFLPHLNESASIFVDSASSSLASYLFLEKLIDQLNHSKVPRRFLTGQNKDRRRMLIDLVSQRRFTLMHMVERLKREQNSMAWIRMEPNDYVPHPKTVMKWV